MANYKVPRAVEIVDDLPVNAAGKVEKDVLRARAAGPEGVAVDTRYSPEQLELRSATAALLADLGPRTVADLDDDGRRARLSKAAESAGWYDLRGPGDDDGPLASGVEIAIVARELGRARGRHTLLRSRHRRRPGTSGQAPVGSGRHERRPPRQRCATSRCGRATSPRRRGRLRRRRGARSCWLDDKRRRRRRRHPDAGHRSHPCARSRWRPGKRWTRVRRRVDRGRRRSSGAVRWR